MATKLRLVRCAKCLKVLPEPPDVLLYTCGGCGATLQAKKKKNSSIDTPLQKLEEDSSGKQKIKQVSDDQEAGSSSNQQPMVNSINKLDQNSDHSDLHSEIKDQDAAKKAVNNGKGKMKQVSDDQDPCSSSNQQSLINSINEPNQNIYHNDPRSSTELSGNEDPESSPEAAAHNRIDQEQNKDQHQAQDVTDNATSTFVGVEHSPNKQKMEQLSDDQILEDCKNGGEFENSSRELTSSSEKISQSQEAIAIANAKTIRDSDGGSKSSFKGLIAEKLPDTRQKKPVYFDEDDVLSEDESADLCHRSRFDRINSVEALENARFSGTNYYGYDGSVSSFDENDNQNPRKNRFKRRNEFHNLDGRLGKGEHRSTDVRSYYEKSSPTNLGLNEFHENPRHRSPIIPKNPNLERIELLKMVRELQDQLEKTNITNQVLNHPGRYGQRMAFSGETTAVNRRRDGGTYYNCCPQDRRFSAQLPRPHVCCNGPHHGPNYGPSTCCSSHCSGPSSPQHNLEPEYFAPARRKPEPYHSTKKRYIRPIAGGSPWIKCYMCLEVIELPQSFLVLKKRYHSLKCGVCMKVLNFTVSKGIHVSRYYPEETIAAPPCSEVEDYADLTESRAGPVSCSDRSFEKSYSTETDRKAMMSRDPSGSTGPPSSTISVRRKTTSEIEEVEARPTGSPLHRLMGYASPSKVIRG